jgi:hypothetical protein
MTVTWEERQRRIQAAERVTVNQARYLADLVDARYERDDEVGRGYWRERWARLGSTPDDTVSKMIDELKGIETLSARADRETAEAREALKAAVPSEAGYYRNPDTGELWRITLTSSGPKVWKYSVTGGPRRLLADASAIVKGKWNGYSAYQSRRALHVTHSIKRSWKIDTETLAIEYAYNFCPFHNGPLTDGVSVILGYGKDCAAKHGLPWGEEAAQAVLAARRASQEG